MIILQKCIGLLNLQNLSSVGKNPLHFSFSVTKKRAFITIVQTKVALDHYEMMAKLFIETYWTYMLPAHIYIYAVESSSGCPALDPKHQS